MKINFFQIIFASAIWILTAISQASTARIGDVVNVFTNLNFIKINVGDFEDIQVANAQLANVQVSKTPISTEQVANQESTTQQASAQQGNREVLTSQGQASGGYWRYKAGKCFYRPVVLEEDRISCQKTRFVYSDGFSYQCVMVMDAIPGEYIRGCNLNQL